MLYDCPKNTINATKHKEHHEPPHRSTPHLDADGSEGDAAEVAPSLLSGARVEHLQTVRAPAGGPVRGHLAARARLVQLRQLRHELM